MMILPETFDFHSIGQNDDILKYKTEIEVFDLSS